MIINKDNSLDIKKMLIHDDVILDFTFDRDDRILTLNLVDGYNNESYYRSERENRNEKFAWMFYSNHYIIKFINVIGFEMTSCDFWGKSNRINGISINENKELIDRLIYKANDIKGIIHNEDGSTKDDIKYINKDNFIEVRIEFISGDMLIVACEIINYGK